MDYADLALAADLEENPAAADVICEVFLKICRGFFSAEYVALVTDRWPDSLTFGDAYCFAKVHTMLLSGDALLTQIEAGEEPHLDKYVAENNEVLQDLPSPFSGRFWGGRADQDGIIKWREPILGSVKLASGKEKRRQIPPGSAPLEVGHTKGYTTLLHLNGQGNVARWPYHASHITIIHRLGSKGI